MNVGPHTFAAYAVVCLSEQITPGRKVWNVKLLEPICTIITLLTGIHIGMTTSKLNLLLLKSYWGSSFPYATNILLLEHCFPAGAGSS